MTFGGGHHVFRAVVDNLDGFTRLQGQQSRVPGNERWVLFLTPKAAAGLSLNYTDFVLRQGEEFNERCALVGHCMEPHTVTPVPGFA